MTARDLNELFGKARSGDAAAEKHLFDYLIERFGQFARLRIWNPADADEVVQETMMTISREYRALEVTTSFTAWAYKVLDNRILACLQSQQTRYRRMDSGDEALQTVPAAGADPQLNRRLLDCLKKICAANRQYGRVINLHSQGYQTEEICARARLKASTLYSLLHRGRALLRRCLESGEIR